MTNTNLSTIRAGASLMKKIVNEVADSYDYEDLSFGAVREYVKDQGGKFDAETKKGLETMFKYAANAENGGDSYITPEQFGKALQKAVKFTAREAATEGSKSTLSPTEQRRLAKTFDALVEFSKMNKGCSIDEALYIDA